MPSGYFSQNYHIHMEGENVPYCRFLEFGASFNAGALFSHTIFTAALIDLVAKIPKVHQHTFNILFISKNRTEAFNDLILMPTVAQKTLAFMYLSQLPSRIGVQQCTKFTTRFGFQFFW